MLHEPQPKIDEIKRRPIDTLPTRRPLKHLTYNFYALILRAISNSAIPPATEAFRELMPP